MCVMRARGFPGDDVEDPGDEADPEPQPQRRPEADHPAQIDVAVPLDPDEHRAERDQHDRVADQHAVVQRVAATPRRRWRTAGCRRSGRRSCRRSGCCGTWCTPLVGCRPSIDGAIRPRETIARKGDWDEITRNQSRRQGTIPSSRALLIASVRRLAPSFSYSRATCVLTVLGETLRCAAISLLEWPAASSLQDRQFARADAERGLRLRVAVERGRLRRAAAAACRGRRPAPGTRARSGRGRCRPNASAPAAGSRAIAAPASPPPAPRRRSPPVSTWLPCYPQTPERRCVALRGSPGTRPGSRLRVTHLLQKLVMLRCERSEPRSMTPPVLSQPWARSP